MLFTLLSTLVLILASLSVRAQSPAWHLDTFPLLVNERFDPVVSPNAAAQHMHEVIGGSNFASYYNYDDLLASSCTTSAIQADKSNYWMPKLYWINNGGSSFTPLTAFHRFYYFLARGSDVQPLSPFPKGLRMVAGSPEAKASNGIAHFTCHVNADLITGDIMSDNFNFNRDCPYGIRLEILFPSCWDGINLYSKDNSHVIYPVGSPDTRIGQCPWDHPVKMPQIMLEYTFSPSSWASGQTIAGNLAWANGDTTGYGAHADFANG